MSTRGSRRSGSRSPATRSPSPTTISRSPAGGVQAGLVSSLDVEQARAARAQTAAAIPNLETRLRQRHLPARGADRAGAGRADRRARGGKADPAGAGRCRGRHSRRHIAPAPRRPRRRARRSPPPTARIGVAEAQLYPALRLTGNIGTSAFSLGGLFDVDHRRPLRRPEPDPVRRRPAALAGPLAAGGDRGARSPPIASRC